MSTQPAFTYWTGLNSEKPVALVLIELMKEDATEGCRVRA
jgi:hypothetical protein